MKKANTTNRNTNITPITFVQAKTIVTADRYVPHALYTQNTAIVDDLGGEMIKGVGEFRAKFKKVADAKAFVEQAVTFMPAKEYNAARKTEPKAPAKSTTKATNGKGASTRKPAVEYVTVTDSDGLTYKVPKTALAPAKGKGAHKPMSGRVGVESEQKVLLESKGRKAAKGKGADKPTQAKTTKTEKSTPKRTRNAKGNGFDFSAIKGADNKAKNKALHATLVSMGMADSRTPEYQAVWNARPWAK